MPSQSVTGQKLEVNVVNAKLYMPVVLFEVMVHIIFSELYYFKVKPSREARMSDVHLLSGISGLLFDFPFPSCFFALALSALSFFCS